MNIVFHALVGLFLAEISGITSLPAILTGILFSVFPDFDHIPHLRKAFRTGRFEAESRSLFHEVLGLVLVLPGSLVVKAICAPAHIYPHLFLLAFICGLSHFIIDFLTRPCRPLYPFSVRKFDLDLYPKGLKQMFIRDATLTISLILIYLTITTV